MKALSRIKSLRKKRKIQSNIALVSFIMFSIVYNHFYFKSKKKNSWPKGTKKRLGFRKNKQTTSFSVHRSEEVLPDEVRHLVKQYSSLSSDGEGSVSGESSSINT